MSEVLSEQEINGLTLPSTLGVEMIIASHRALHSQVRELEKLAINRTEDWHTAQARIAALEAELKAQTESHGVTVGHCHNLVQRITQLEQEKAKQFVDLTAREGYLEKELAQRKGWQKCPTHGEINADHAWGCPDCLRECKHRIAQLDHASAQQGGIRHDTA